MTWGRFLLLKNSAVHSHGSVRGRTWLRIRRRLQPRRTLTRWLSSPADFSPRGSAFRHSLSAGDILSEALACHFRSALPRIGRVRSRRTCCLGSCPESRKVVEPTLSRVEGPAVRPPDAGLFITPTKESAADFHRSMRIELSFVSGHGFSRAADAPL